MVVRPIVAIGVAGLLLAACGREQSEEEISQAMDAVYARFSEGYATLDANVVGSLYTDDALYLAPEGDIDRGRADIAAGFHEFFERLRQQGRAARISFSSVDRGADDDVAYDIGYYELVTVAGRDTVGRSRGKFATVWKRGDDGAWRIHADSYSSVPPERPAEGEAP